MKVICDTDPGVDDALALLLLHRSPDVDLLGVTTVFGNGSIETTTRNALFLCDAFGIEAPVARGAARPLLGVADEAPASVHGANGLGDIAIPSTAKRALDQDATGFISETVRQNPREIVVLCLGRLTNLARALQADGALVDLVQRVVVMGGAFGFNGRRGNITPLAEANIFGDPEAAQVVFAAPWSIDVVGLDVTEEIVMSPDYLSALASRLGDTGKLIHSITRVYERFYRDTRGLEGIVPHDAVAATYLLAPDLFETQGGSIEVMLEGEERGRTLIGPGRSAGGSSSAHVTVCSAVDRVGVLELYLSTVTSPNAVQDARAVVATRLCPIKSRPGVDTNAFRDSRQV